MVGQTLGGRYQILEELGSSGQTYLAQDGHRPEQSWVVIRRWQPRSPKGEEPSAARQRFEQAMALWERLGSHECISRLLTYFEQEGDFYWVEEWIEGQTLEQALRQATEQGQPWTEAEVRAFLQDVLQTLALLHSEGVNCCNLEPSRLICRRADGRWVVLGLGCCNSGPEAADSDLEALGLIAIQALSGIPTHKLFRDPLTGELRWHDLAPTSAPFAAFLDCLGGCDPRQRFASAAAALAALQALPLAEGVSPGAEILPDPVAAAPLQEPTTPPRSSVSLRARFWIPPLWAGSSLAALLVLLGAAAWQLAANLSLWGEKAIVPRDSVPPAGTRANLGSAGLKSFSSPEQPPNPSRTGSLSSSSPALNLADWAKSLQLKATLEGPAAITALAISPDGDLLVAGGDDGVIRFWDPQAGQLLQSWAGHEGSIETLAISPDGTFLVSGGADKTVRVWDLVTLGDGVPRLQLQGHTELINSVAISPDGRWIASGSADRTIRLWQAEDGQLVRTIDSAAHPVTQGSGITAVAFAPSGVAEKRSPPWILVAANGDPTVHLWDPGSGALLKTLEADYPIEQVLLSPDGRHLLAASASGVWIWNVGTGSLERTLAQPLSGLATLALSPDGRLLASGTDHRAQQIKLWDLGSGKELRTLGGQTWMVSALLFGPNGQTLLSGGADGAIRIWGPEHPASEGDSALRNRAR
ncbi:protein kinase domain-containing protein [Synechococcus sp. H55.11]|uniref:WD40 domain-containing protein n=1 Tax=unclassified Synechococcus TaxID=2626047 RepID=UPI0039C225A9